MPINIGIDLGSVSVKAALYSTDKNDGEFFCSLKENPLFQRVETLSHPGSGELFHLAVTSYARIAGNPMQQARKILESLEEIVGRKNLGEVTATGSGAGLLKQEYSLTNHNEFACLARAVELLLPEVRTVFEMGGENSKYILLEKNESSDNLGIVDYQTNGDCAAGTGGFLDQQAGRLRFKIEDIGDIVLATGRAPKIAGRCSVFAKSDMIHAQQKGFSPEEILKGLCESVARNFKSAITKGKTVTPKVAFVGGVAANRGVVQALEMIFGWEENSLLIPQSHASLGAIGAAVQAEALSTADDWKGTQFSLSAGNGKRREFPHGKKLSMENVVLLRDKMKALEPAEIPDQCEAFLGIDIGSVSTNLVLIDSDCNVLREIYLRTDSRPIEAVGKGLREIETDLGEKIIIRGVGTTGSGRELIGELVGADTINDEITAHKTGASFIDHNILNLGVDTIFEIGGQDSKYISLEKGVVVDFAMNEACAAGTGSFLEERAKELGIEIKGEFAEIALGSDDPLRLGERCTVFMERDVNSYLQRGAELKRVVAGLAYSVATNYINRVVRGRKIGEVIFFQGGTAYNDSVAAAFSSILGKRIIVPPFNGVIGALGEALLARQKMLEDEKQTRFRGFNLDQVDYKIREFTCKACTNYCQMQEFTVDGERTYWGDKCSERYRKAVKAEREPVIEDLIALRGKLLTENYDPSFGSGPVVGIPFCMSSYDWMPFWLRFFRELDIRVLISEPTTNQITNLAMECVVSEPCYPIQVAHGHVRWLIEQGVDKLFVPNNISTPGGDPMRPLFFCPWNQTLPYVVRAAPMISDHADKIIMPTLWFSQGVNEVSRSLFESMKDGGLRRTKAEIKNAVLKAFEAQDGFARSLYEAGARAMAVLDSHQEHGILLLGRPYNIYDKGINLDIAAKLRKLYGANVIGLDFLDLDSVDISDIHENMFWSHGKKILAAARVMRDKPKMHIIYITNFKCGPDSYIKHFVTEASGRPYLSLQFDGHNSDAGMLTRCEAYLDSKGVLRRWGTTEQEMAAKARNL